MAKIIISAVCFLCLYMKSNVVGEILFAETAGIDFETWAGVIKPGYVLKETELYNRTCYCKKPQLFTSSSSFHYSPTVALTSSGTKTTTTTSTTTASTTTTSTTTTSTSTTSTSTTSTTTTSTTTTSTATTYTSTTITSTTSTTTSSTTTTTTTTSTTSTTTSTTATTTSSTTTTPDSTTTTTTTTAASSDPCGSCSYSHTAGTTFNFEEYTWSSPGWIDGGLGEYPDNCECTLTITVTAATGIQFHYELDMDSHIHSDGSCSYDKLAFYFPDTTGTAINTYCDENVGSSSHLQNIDGGGTYVFTFIFTSSDGDGDEQDSGFKLKYKVLAY